MPWTKTKEHAYALHVGSAVPGMPPQKVVADPTTQALADLGERAVEDALEVDLGLVADELANTLDIRLAI